MADFSERLFFVKTIQTVKIWLKIFTVIIYVYQPMKGRFTFMELKVINWNGLKKAQTAFIIKYFYGIKIPHLFWLLQVIQKENKKISKNVHSYRVCSFKIWSLYQLYSLKTQSSNVIT